MRAREGNEQADKATNTAQEDAFGENLAEDAAASRSEGHAHGHIAALRSGAGQHQVGDVGAGDQQYYRRENHQHL